MEPYSVHHVMINDLSLIELVREEQMLDPNLQIDSLEFIDATRNGFGEGDLMVIYPNKQILPLLKVEGRLRSTMDTWKFKAAHQVTSQVRSSIEMLQLARELQDPKTAILATILQALENYYQGPTVEGYFRRDKESAFIQLWNFNLEQLKFREGGAFGIADTVRAYDILKVVKNDTVLVADSTLYDALYIFKNRSATIQLNPLYGKLSFSSEPAGALIYLDGEKMGRTPLSCEKALSGVHLVRCRLDNYYEIIDTVIVENQTHHQLHYQLTESGGWLNMVTDPNEASVLITDSSFSLGYTPLEKAPLPVGTHNLRVEKELFEPTEIAIQINRGEITNRTLELIRKSGELEVHSRPPGANVFLDSLYRGKTPVTLSDVPTGIHQVRITKPWYDKIEEEVTVNHNYVTTIEKRLTNRGTWKKRRSTALNLALIVPGGGQIVSGQKFRGWCYLGAFSGTMFLAGLAKMDHAVNRDKYYSERAAYLESAGLEAQNRHFQAASDAIEAMNRAQERTDLFLNLAGGVYALQFLDAVLFGGGKRSFKVTPSSTSAIGLIPRADLSNGNVFLQIQIIMGSQVVRECQ